GGSYTITGGALTTQAGNIDVGGTEGNDGGPGTFTVNSGSNVSVGVSFGTHINSTTTINNGAHVAVTQSTGVDGTLDVNGGILDTPGATNGQGLQVDLGTVNLAGGTINAGDVYC